MTTIFPSEASALVRRLSNGRVRVEADDHQICFISCDTGMSIRLQRYQLTELGITQALVDFTEYDRVLRLIPGRASCNQFSWGEMSFECKNRS